MSAAYDPLDPPDPFEGEDPHIFRCDGCGMPFESLFVGDDGQASGCSTESDGRFASSHYGSSFDGEAFARLPGSAEIPAGDVCDACVFRLLADGQIAPVAPQSRRALEALSPQELNAAIAERQSRLLEELRQEAELRLNGVDPFA